MHKELLYFLTVYLPLKIRDLFINFLALFMRRDRVIEISYRLLKEKKMIGVLHDGSLISYPLDEFKLLSIISEIYGKRIYDVRQIESFEHLCDIGAHIGLFTLRMSKLASNSKIIAVEPNPTNYRFLVRNASLNGLRNRVQALNVAVGERKGRASLSLSKLSRGDSSIKRWHDAGAAGSVRVGMIPLDDILSKEKVCDLAKIDVEGMECEVLRGLEKQYRKVSRLVMEVHLSAANEAEIREWLHKHGFVITKAQRLYESCILLEAKRMQT